MKQSTADHYNRMAKLTPEQRDEEIVREILGPFFARVFPQVTPPKAPTDEPEPTP